MSDEFQKKLEKSASLGPTLLRKVDRLAAKSGRSRSEEIVRICNIAIAAPRPPPLQDEGRYLDDSGREGWGRATIRADDLFWNAVDRRARRFGEARSESLRALLLGGLAISEPVYTVDAQVEEAMGCLRHHADEAIRIRREVARHFRKLFRASRRVGRRLRAVISLEQPTLEIREVSAAEERAEIQRIRVEAATYLRDLVEAERMLAKVSAAFFVRIDAAPPSFERISD